MFGSAAASVALVGLLLAYLPLKWAVVLSLSVLAAALFVHRAWRAASAWRSGPATRFCPSAGEAASQRIARIIREI